MLDVSCGLGYGSWVLWANAAPEHITGIDLSPFAVQYATHADIPWTTAMGADTIDEANDSSRLTTTRKEAL